MKSSQEKNLFLLCSLQTESFVWYQGEADVCRNYDKAIQKGFGLKIKSLLTFTSLDHSATRDEILMINFFVQLNHSFSILDHCAKLIPNIFPYWKITNKY